MIDHGLEDDHLSRRHTKPFLQHLEDLRRTVLICALAYAAGIAIAIPAVPWIVETLKLPLAGTGADPAEFLRVIRIAGGLSIAMRTVSWSGLLISLPFIVVAVGYFVFPGLREEERKTIAASVGFAAVLFALGVAMGYFVTLPVALRMMFRINEWLGIECDFVELADYIGFVIKLLIAFGLAFQMPVVVLALGKMGIVDSNQLRRWRGHVIIVILIAAMLLTPPDPVTMLLMALPMALLYEMCVWIVRGWERVGRR